MQEKLNFDTDEFQPTSIGLAKITEPIVFIYDGEINAIETKFSEKNEDGTVTKLMYCAYGKLGANNNYLGKVLTKGTQVQLLFNSTALNKSFIQYGAQMKGLSVKITGRGAGVERKYHIESL